jgi:hypothetical protein
MGRIMRGGKFGTFTADESSTADEPYSFDLLTNKSQHLVDILLYISTLVDI